MKTYLAIWLLALIAAFGVAPARATELTNGRITVELAVPSSGITTADADRIDQISWINSNGVSTGNLTSNFPSVFCNDLQWYFGDSYGDDSTGEPRQLYAVYGGEVSAWHPLESGRSGLSVSNGVTSCGQQWSAKVKTAYRLETNAQVANALRVTRRFTFLPYAKTLPLVNLRSFVPRLPLPNYAMVLVPETDGTIHSYNLDIMCGSACDIHNWAGTWFADDDGKGDGMVVIRDKSSTWPAVIAMDNDGGAAGTGGANATSIALIYPAGGWTGVITETQWVCFYDSTSWPAADRAAGELPEGCQVHVATGIAAVRKAK